MEVRRRSLKELSQQRKRRGKAARRRNLCTKHVGPKVCFLPRISAGCTSGEGRSLPIAGVGSPVAQLGGQLSGGEIAHPAVAGPPSAVGRVDGLDVGSAAGAAIRAETLIHAPGPI
jgi:hypothetical protein